MWNIMVLQRFYGCLFCSSKKSLFEKMGDVGRFVIGECVMAKAINVLHLSGCSGCYGSDNKTKRLVGLVVTNVDIPTSTGRASWLLNILSDMYLMELMYVTYVLYVMYVMNVMYITYVMFVIFIKDEMYVMHEMFINM